MLYLLPVSLNSLFLSPQTLQNHQIPVTYTVKKLPVLYDKTVQSNQILDIHSYVTHNTFWIGVT